MHVPYPIIKTCLLHALSRPPDPHVQITFLSLMASNDGMLYTEVQEYYGKTLQSSNDLKTNACCTTSGKKRPRSVLEALSLVHDEVIMK